MTPAERYSQWLNDTARGLRAADPSPGSAAETRERTARIRARMRASAGDWPESPAPLQPEMHGELKRDGYRVELITFQTRPGCHATASVYVPDPLPAKCPAVLCVHGHWAGARRDPVVQSRCIGLAKLGFVALTLDAWGAGERGTLIGTNEYHGGLLGASLWPVGTPLYGMQLYDNIRALDYLQSRPEVLPDRIGCTGASGGGNQTTQLSAFDDRIQCAVPVCSVGTFASYLTAACCVDEMLLDALSFAEEGDLLGLVAPRALMVITATRDSFHFGPIASAEAVERAKGYFEAHGVGDRVRHTLFESGHDYSRPMREAMYGWMARWLKGQGDGSPIPEPTIQTEDPELLRCFPKPFRPGRVMTTVEWVRQRAEELTATERAPTDAGEWATERRRRVEILKSILHLPNSGAARHTAPPAGAGAGRSTAELEVEPGVSLPIHLERPAEPRGGAALLLHPLGGAAALDTPLARGLVAEGITVMAPDLRGCGSMVLKAQGLGAQIPDHNLCEWSFWIARPLFGQWVHDIRQVAAAARKLGSPSDRVALIGWKEAGLTTLAAAALDSSVRGVAALEAPATFTQSGVPHNVRMVAFQPHLLKVGDVPMLAALAAPRPVLIGDPIQLDGSPVAEAGLPRLAKLPLAVYRVAGAGDAFTLNRGESPSAQAVRIRDWLLD